MSEKTSIAQLESQLIALLPAGTYHLDPPDGGDVPPIEQVRRLIDDLRARLAEYESAPPAAPVPDIFIEVRNGVSVGVFPGGRIVNPHYAQGWNDNNSYRAAMLAKQGGSVPDESVLMGEIVHALTMAISTIYSSAHDVPEVTKEYVNDVLKRCRAAMLANGEKGKSDENANAIS